MVEEKAVTSSWDPLIFDLFILSLNGIAKRGVVEDDAVAVAVVNGDGDGDGDDDDDDDCNEGNKLDSFETTESVAVFFFFDNKAFLRSSSRDDEIGFESVGVSVSLVLLFLSINLLSAVALLLSSSETSMSSSSSVENEFEIMTGGFWCCTALLEI